MDSVGNATPISRSGTHRDSLGCASSGLSKDGEVATADVRFYRKRKDSAAPAQVATPASDRGYLLGVSMSAGHRRQIIHGHHRTSKHDFGAGMVYLREFSEDYRADLTGAFDFLLMEISPAAFERAHEGVRGARVRGLECVTAMQDEVLHHLAVALATVIDRPHETTSLFLDQMSIAVSTYLVDRYGGQLAKAGPPRGRLSRLHEARAKEMLRSRLDGSMSIGEIADACNLSRSYFIRAFRETTGKTPLQWLLGERLSIARGLLLDSPLTLAEISDACGFADQSHFTRAFVQAEGQPPGGWRRQVRLP